MDILCVDSEKEFVQSLEKEGHTVHSAELGYKTGRCCIETAPHEVDAIISNLEKPTCFDIFKWGKGNDNYNCIIETSPTDEIVIIDRKYGQKHEEPRFQLILRNQIKEQPSPFKVDDIIKAITVGGIPLFVFLNESYLKHVGYEYGSTPNFFGVDLQYPRTKAANFNFNDDFVTIFPELLKNHTKLRIPIKYKIEHKPRQRSIDIMYNNIGDIFSKIICHKKGLVWLLPEFKKNDVAILYILQELTYLKNFVLNILLTGQVSPRPKPKSVIIGIDESDFPKKPEVIKEKTGKLKNWDLFICHASEDKEAIARPICNALNERGLSVWFDEFTLKLGDSLRRKIEEGLINSNYGLVILSPDFFAKKWPQDELDGLFSLEQNGRKRILPIWHNIDERGVRKFSPILAGRYAAKSDEGMDVIIAKILDVVSE